MLTAKAVSLGRGDQPILSAVSLSVGPRTRLGVVGPNGIGKSTLLRVLAGMETPEAGSVERSPATLRVGYLAQEPDGVAGESLLGYLARRSGVAAAGAELDRRTDLLAGDPEQIDAYGAALDHFLVLGGADFEARAATVCADLGLGTDRLAVALEDLSGGQAARAGLAAIMVSRFDVFLLDEPTNDLDFEGLDRLEGFLAALPGAVVVVSHDRAFLDRSVHRILELAEHLHTATEYAGAWSEYVERRATARSQQQAAFGVWDEQRRRLAERVRAQRSWSESGVRKAVKRPKDHDRAQRGFFINRTEKQASKVRTSERALERLPTVDKPWEGWDLHLDLAPTDRSGNVVARLDGAVVERGTFRLGPVDVEIGWAERVVITGPNGGGKSTLLGALTGSVGLAGGARWAGPGVRFGELDQRRSRLVGATLLEGFTARTGTRPEEARSTLAKFGLGADQVLRRIDRLSPGERTRALLAALSVEGTNCLVLDEPTNHLDLPAIEQLEAALEDFAGTLLLVTHDRWLLETVRVDRSVEVDAGRVIVGL
ncbi:MAG: ATP-binding cassette domain-containing protein [Actinomycetota bacterium]|nr:ATP-binding cassette domain-containing protein [Actinomycetota bacterium]